MKKLMIYLKGGLIGMIAEYCFRVEFGYLQEVILSALIISMIIDIVSDWNK
jgi:hypothetical protein